ncbi:hypothetical protein OH768_13890 [Streptomyces sp. NBC_01622]|uniref:hypothetical protein n=1 Tax=Streptomyces sp. NBC_01622 TaxID=2975903 RepID=UPI00386396A5|nr:hypothetical protein OH768_13890 [Streptomyces sp. NBC_01622]
MAVFAEADAPLRARNVFEAMDLDLVPNNINNVRIKLKRVTGHGIPVVAAENTGLLLENGPEFDLTDALHAAAAGITPPAGCEPAGKLCLLGFLLLDQHRARLYVTGEGLLVALGHVLWTCTVPMTFSGPSATGTGRSRAWALPAAKPSPWRAPWGTCPRCRCGRSSRSHSRGRPWTG